MAEYKNKTILIIGAGRLQLPAIKRAKELGLFTIATDYNPEAYGLTVADDQIIISTRDVDGSVRKAKEYYQNKRKIDGVLTVGTDASMTVAAVANALGLPGIKFINAEAASNKLKMRSRLKEFGVPCPDYFECWTAEEALINFDKLDGPVVLKPADNMGARGVSKASNKGEILKAFAFAKNATPSGEVIMEEYMVGPELSIDALIFDGKINITGVADRVIAFPPYFVETGHIMPSNLPEAQINDAIDVMCQGIKALGIDIGAAKGDIKVTPKGAMVGEIAARLSGGFMSAYTYPYSSGVDLMENAIRIALGIAPHNLSHTKNKVAIESAIIPGEGRVEKIDNLSETLALPGVANIFLNVDIGENIATPKSNVEKAGHIIVTADTRHEALAISQQALKTLKIELARV